MMYELLISKDTVNHPSVLKFIELLNSSGKTLRNLAVYISKAFEKKK